MAESGDGKQRGRRRRRGRGRGGNGARPEGGQAQPGAAGGAPVNHRGGNRDSRQGGGNQPRRGQDGGHKSPPKAERRLPDEAPHVHIPKRYGIVFYDSLAAAKADLAQVADKAAAVDQLNVVIRAEANMEDPDLLAVGKVKIFAGSAWTTVHERRQQDGWYDEPR